MALLSYVLFFYFISPYILFAFFFFFFAFRLRTVLPRNMKHTHIA